VAWRKGLGIHYRTVDSHHFELNTISVLNSVIQPVYGLIPVTSAYTIRVQPNTHYTGSIQYGPVYGLY
jgi:hypothetical protein